MLAFAKDGLFMAAVVKALVKEFGQQVLTDLVNEATRGKTDCPLNGLLGR